MSQQLEISVPLNQWHQVMQNPYLWVESIEAIRRIGGTAEFDTRVQESTSGRRKDLSGSLGPVVESDVSESHTEALADGFDLPVTIKLPTLHEIRRNITEGPLD